MGDLFSKHPTRIDVWLFRGRVDDLIASPAYDTFLPKSMESIMECNPEIEVAVICQIKCIFVGMQNRAFFSFEEFDDRKSGLALLVEPNTYPHSDHDRAKLLHRIWPSVQCANVICPVDARI